jgi:hypothetical protein
MLKSVAAPGAEVAYITGLWIGTNLVSKDKCTITNDTLSCELGLLPVSGAATLTLEVFLSGPGKTWRSSSLSSAELDAAQANHTVANDTFAEFGVNQDRIVIKPYGRMQILVTWPQQTGVFLQSTDSLSSPNWQGLGIPFWQNWIVIINDFQTNRFYRLYTPGF